MLIGNAPLSSQPISSARGSVFASMSLTGSGALTARLSGVLVGKVTLNGTASIAHSIRRVRRVAININGGRGTIAIDGRRSRRGAVFTLSSGSMTVEATRIRSAQIPMTATSELQVTSTTSYLALLDDQTLQKVYTIELSIWAVSDRVAA